VGFRVLSVALSAVCLLDDDDEWTVSDTERQWEVKKLL
jgi:hypothetical protein